MQRLKRSVGIDLGAGPFAPTEVSGADQNGSGDRGRNDIRATGPLGVYGGERVTANSVDARIDFGPREVREPALLIGVTVLPLLHLIKLLSPVDVGVAQQIVNIFRSAPGLVGISNLIGKCEKAGDDVGCDEDSARDSPTTVDTRTTVDARTPVQAGECDRGCVLLAEEGSN